MQQKHSLILIAFLQKAFPYMFAQIFSKLVMGCTITKLGIPPYLLLQQMIVNTPTSNLQPFIFITRTIHIYLLSNVIFTSPTTQIFIYEKVLLVSTKIQSKYYYSQKIMNLNPSNPKFSQNGGFCTRDLEKPLHGD